MDDPDWAAFYDRLRGPRLHAAVDGVRHNDFSDLTLFKSQFDLGSVFDLGPIDGSRARTIVRAYARAWLDRSLLGRPSRLLVREPARFPESTSSRDRPAAWSVGSPDTGGREHGCFGLAREGAVSAGSRSGVGPRAMTEDEYVAQQLAEFAHNGWGPDDDDWEPGDELIRQEWRAALVEVVGPDTLLQSQPLSGTHSVIDMVGVADAPGDEMVAPLPAEVLDDVFGTRHPTALAVQAAIDEHRIGGFSRGQGAYRPGVPVRRRDPRPLYGGAAIRAAEAA